MNTFGYIYRTQNTSNGVFYIGQHKGPFEPRYFGSGLSLIKAFKEYGKRVFKVEVIEYASNQERLDELEKQFIKSHRDAGIPLYNRAAGGRAGFVAGCPSGKAHPNYGRKWSPQVRENMRQAAIGKKLSPETKAKLSMVRRGENHWTKKNGRNGKLSPSHILNVSRAMIGKKQSPESIARRVATCKLTKAKNALMRAAPSLQTAELILAQK